MWVCHISRWAWDTGGRPPNVGMPHQQMGMGHWWEGPYNVGVPHQEMGMGHIIVRYWA